MSKIVGNSNDNATILLIGTTDSNRERICSKRCHRRCLNAVHAELWWPRFSAGTALRLLLLSISSRSALTGWSVSSGHDLRHDLLLHPTIPECVAVPL